MMYNASEAKEISDFANSIENVEEKIDGGILRAARNGGYKQYFTVPTKHLNTIVDDLSEIGYYVTIDEDDSNSKVTSIIVKW